MYNSDFIQLKKLQKNLCCFLIASWDQQTLSKVIVKMRFSLSRFLQSLITRSWSLCGRSNHYSKSNPAVLRKMCHSICGRRFEKYLAEGELKLMRRRKFWDEPNDKSFMKMTNFWTKKFRSLSDVPLFTLVESLKMKHWERNILSLHDWMRDTNVTWSFHRTNFPRSMKTRNAT